MSRARRRRGSSGSDKREEERTLEAERVGTEGEERLQLSLTPSFLASGEKE